MNRIALPWNNWFHCMGSTYGTWLRGDPRGWRARHHREHVEGDYRNPPPPGRYDEIFAQSKSMMKRDAVLLDWAQRVIVCREMGRSLVHYNVEIVDLSVGAAHFHLLARFTPLDVDLYKSPGIRIPELRDARKVNRYELLKRVARHYVGIAKKNSARLLTDAGLVAPGGIWAVRGKIKAILDRSHQLNVVRYVRDHGKHGAAVWSVICEQRQ